MNPVRSCIGCGASDDHPRCVVILPDGNAAAWHMDCHILVTGCPICKAQLEGVGGVEGNPKGDDLRAHLELTGSTYDLPGWTAPAGDETKG